MNIGSLINLCLILEITYNKMFDFVTLYPMCIVKRSHSWIKAPFAMIWFTYNLTQNKELVSSVRSFIDSRMHSSHAWIQLDERKNKEDKPENEELSSPRFCKKREKMQERRQNNLYIFELIHLLPKKKKKWYILVIEDYSYMTKWRHLQKLLYLLQ